MVMCVLSLFMYMITIMSHNHTHANIYTHLHTHSHPDKILSFSSANIFLIHCLSGMFRPHNSSEAKGGNTFSSTSGEDFFDSKFEDDDDDDGGGGGGGMIMIDIDGAADSKTLDHYLAGTASPLTLFCSYLTVRSQTLLCSYTFPSLPRFYRTLA